MTPDAGARPFQARDDERVKETSGPALVVPRSLPEFRFGLSRVWTILVVNKEFCYLFRPIHSGSATMGVWLSDSRLSG